MNKFLKLLGLKSRSHKMPDTHKSIMNPRATCEFPPQAACPENQLEALVAKSESSSIIQPYKTVWPLEAKEWSIAESSRQGPLPNRPDYAAYTKSEDSWENESEYCNSKETWLNGSSSPLSPQEALEAAIYRRRFEDGKIKHGHPRLIGSDIDPLNAAPTASPGGGTSTDSEPQSGGNWMKIGIAPTSNEPRLIVDECLSHTLGSQADTGFEPTNNTNLIHTGGLGSGINTNSSTIFASVPGPSLETLLAGVVRREVGRALVEFRRDFTHELKHDLASEIEARVFTAIADAVQPTALEHGKNQLTEKHNSRESSSQTDTHLLLNKY